MGKILFSREDIGIRIKEIRGSLTYKQFGSTLDISPGFISDIEKGIKKPSPEMMFSIANNFPVNLNWLLTGEGPKYKKDLTPQEKFTYNTEHKEKDSGLRVSDNEGPPYDPWPELTRMQAQVKRIYKKGFKKGDREGIIKLQGFLAALDPGEEIEDVKKNTA